MIGLLIYRCLDAGAALSTHIIAQQVYARLDQLGMTLSDLAEKTDLSLNTL